MDERAGGCLCGAVRYVAALQSASVGACHCGMCRRWTGGPLLSVQTGKVRFTSEATVAAFPSSAWAERGFCTRCGSSLFYWLTGPGPARGATFLAAGTLDDLEGLVLDHEVFTDRRPAAWCFAGELSGMTEAEVMARYAPS